MPTIDLSAGWVTPMIPRLFRYYESNSVNSGGTLVNSGLLIGDSNNAGAGGLGAASTYPSSCIRLMKGAVPTDFSTIPLSTSRSTDKLVEYLPYALHMQTSQLNINPAIISTAYVAAVLSGAATWFWWFTGHNYTNANTGMVPTIFLNAYGTVGLTGSGADLEIPDTNIVLNEQYRIANLQVHFPTTWNY